MPAFTAALTLSVTSSMPTRTFSSRSGAWSLLVVRLGEEAVVVVVVLGGAELGQGVGADVVVGHDQAVGRDERARSRRC